MKLGGADDRHLATVVRVTNEGAAVAARHGHVAFRLVCLAQAEMHLARARRLPQVAVGLGVTERWWRRRGGSRGASCFTGPRHRLHQQPVAGKGGQPPQQVLVEKIERLRDKDQGVGSCRAFNRGDVAGRDDVHAVLTQDRDQRPGALW